MYFVTLYLGNLRAHVLRVHSLALGMDDFYQCGDCPCVFKKLGSLNAHAAKRHAIPLNQDGQNTPASEKSTNQDSPKMLARGKQTLLEGKSPTPKCALLVVFHL